MALPTVVINSSGSNTAASGAGPATALFGTAASTAASTTVTLLTDNPDLSGVATDGSAVLWVGSSSGRQFSKITGVNNTAGVKTVTVSVAYANTESGKNWGIGGKRATLAGSTVLFNADWALGWTVDVQTGETLTTAIVVTAPSPDGSTSAPVVTSTTYTTWGTQPLIQTTTASLVMFQVGTNGLIWKNLSFKQTSGTPGMAFQATQTTGQNITWENSIFDGFNMALDGSNGAHWGLGNGTIQSCEFKNCTVTAVNFNGSGGAVLDSYFHANATHLTEDGSGIKIIRNVFAAGTSGASIKASFQNAVFSHNSVYGNGGTAAEGAFTNIGATGPGPVVLENNIFYGNAGYGVLVPNGFYPKTFVNRNNAYGSNNGNGTGLDRQNFSAGTGDVTLSASPFVGSTDFALNATAGGGAACKAAGTTIPNASATATAPDIGAVQSAASAGGGAKNIAY